MLKTIYKPAFLLSFLVISPLLSACQSSQSGPGKLGYCKPSASFVDMEAGNGNRKIEVKPGDPFELKPGEYASTEAEYFYNDQDRNIVLLFSVKKNTDGEDTLDIACIGGTGLDRGSQGVVGQIEVISKIKVDTDKKILLSTKVLSFNVGGQDGFSLEVTEKLTDVESTLTKIYDGYPIVEQAFYEISDGSYQTRVKLDEVAAEKGSKAAGLQQWAKVAYKLTPASAP